MCDYSLHHVKSRPAKVGEKLKTVNFSTGTRGFASPDDANRTILEIVRTAVTVRPFRALTHLHYFAVAAVRGASLVTRMT
jgi:hypothetical protein